MVPSELTVSIKKSPQIEAAYTRTDSREIDLRVDLRRGVTVTPESAPASAEPLYRDTPLPFDRSGYRPPREELPQRLREMRRLYAYGTPSPDAKAERFLAQGKFMEDYTDDAPFPGDFVCYFPTYQDLSARKLRGYFSWRSRVRRGVFEPIPASAAYLYLYELLNGIGADSPEDSLRKLKAFETGYLDAGLGSPDIRRNLRRWMLEFAVVREVPPEIGRQFADPETLETDLALAALRRPTEHSDEEVFAALCRLGGKKLSQSPVLAGDAGRGMGLFSEAWRRAAAGFRAGGKDLFYLCFGAPVVRHWFPLSNAVFCWQRPAGYLEYRLDECRVYRCRAGVWQAEAYERSAFDRNRLRGFLHEAELRLRRYLKTGRSLGADPANAWAGPFIDAAIEADRQAVLAAARPKIEIDLTDLDRIRQDAQTTRDSLLIEEERIDPEERMDPEKPSADSAERPEPVSESCAAGIPLDGLQLLILRTLLEGGAPEEILSKNRLMPSVIADGINEVLFDELGDVAVVCEEERLSLVEDYRADIAKLFGGAP